jgi:type II secretory pathway pseudopilin PulG
MLGMENSNDQRIENEKANDLLLKASSASRIGRKGDPRMNRALAARLANPSLLLSEALRIGGFEYPSDDDSNNVDAETVSLAQRKNQLSRRIRMARQQLDQEKTQQFHSDTSTKQTSTDIDDRTKPSNFRLQNLSAGPGTDFNTIYHNSSSPKNQLSGSLQSSILENIDYKKDTSGIQGMNVMNPWKTTNQVVEPSDVAASEVSASQHGLVSGLAIAPSDGITFHNQVKLTKRVDQENQSSVLTYASLLKELLGSDGNSTSHGQTGIANHQVKRSYTDFIESSRIGNQINGPVGFPKPIDSVGDSRVPFGSEATQNFNSYENPIKKHATEIASRQAVALRLFESRAKDLYKGCMQDAGFSPESVQGAESSQEYCQFAIAAWIQQGHYVQSLLTDEMKHQMSQTTMQETIQTPQQNILNLSGASIPNSLHRDNDFGSTIMVPFHQGPRNVPLSVVQLPGPQTNLNRLPVGSVDNCDETRKFTPILGAARNYAIPPAISVQNRDRHSCRVATFGKGLTAHEKQLLIEQKKHCESSLHDLPFQAVDWNQTATTFSDDDSDAILQIFD